MVEYKYCPKCAKEVDLKESYYQCRGCKYKLFPHSAITVSFLPINKVSVMLSRRKLAPQKGKVDVLGGFVNYGEDPKAAIKREMKEETGHDIEILGLLGIYPDEYLYQEEFVPTINIVYVGTITGGKLKVSDDVEKVFWQPVLNMPKELAFRMLRLVMLDLQNWYKANRNML